MPNNLSQFWQDLKRRNVTRVLAVYIAVAFMILELVDMISEPFSLPEWSMKVAFFILLAGLIIMAVVSWIYDFRPEGGIVKTESADKVKDEAMLKSSNGWKIASYISFVVIAGLLIVNVLGRNKHKDVGDVKSVLILPFSNFTGADSLDYLVAGMHSSLISDIQRIHGLKVINKTTSNTYKNSGMSIHEMAKERGVDVVIEGDIMCLGDSICSEFRVIRGSPEEELLWTEDYTEESKQILNLYKRITKQFSDGLRIELSPETESYLAESRNVVPAAYDAYVRGMMHWERLNWDGRGEEDVLMAMEYFQTAIELDPEWADPYAAMFLLGYSGMEALLGVDPMTYKNKALELDPNSAMLHFINAMFSVWPSWDWELGEKEFRKSLQVNPNNALCRIYYAHLLLILRRTGEAVKQAELALELDPRRPLILALYAEVMLGSGNYQAGLTQCKKAFSIEPNNTFAPGTLAKAYLYTGDTLKWYETLKGVNTFDMLNSPDSIFQVQGYYGLYEALARAMDEIYIQSGEINPLYQARNYAKLGDFNKAMDYYDKAYEVQQGLLSYASVDYILYPELKDNPRYIKLLKKMNLPLPSD